MANYNELLSTTDATAWASALTEVVWEDEEGLTEEQLEELLVTWFANAFAAADANQTAVQAIDHAVTRARYHQIVNQYKGNTDSHTLGPHALGVHEFGVAIDRLEEAQMWFTRGLAKVQGKFNPADLEREDGN
jgi:hypothetical protein